MVNWEAAIAGARIGTIIGAIAGLIPLGIGYFRRERWKALIGFAGCLVAGAIGGLYASIAVMALSVSNILRPHDPQANPWKGLATIADKFWYFVMFVCLFVCMFGTMFVSAAYLTPLVMGVPNCTPRDSLGKFIEFIMLFGGLGLGIILGLICVSFISRRLISAETHGHWAKYFEAQASNLPPFLRKAMSYVNRLMLPRERSST